MHDVYLRTAGGATQIDHIVRAGRTIFILETKHFGGACFGRAHERTWTHVNRGAKRRFYNPLLQNDGHVAAVRRAVGGAAACARSWSSAARRRFPRACRKACWASRSSTSF